MLLLDRCRPRTHTDASRLQRTLSPVPDVDIGFLVQLADCGGQCPVTHRASVISSTRRTDVRSDGRIGTDCPPCSFFFAAYWSSSSFYKQMKEQTASKKQAASAEFCGSCLAHMRTSPARLPESGASRGI